MRNFGASENDQVDRIDTMINFTYMKMIPILLPKIGRREYSNPIVVGIWIEELYFYPFTDIVLESKNQTGCPDMSQAINGVWSPLLRSLTAMKNMNMAIGQELSKA